MREVGKLLIMIGIVLVAAGLLLSILPAKRLGRLPGDITIPLKNGKIYIPITTSILVSALLSILLWVISWLRR